LVKTTLGDQVTRAIVEHIQDNDLKPGDMLPAEMTLARQLGVSRPLIREAIRSPTALGVLTTANGKGTTICPVGSYGLTTRPRTARIRRPPSSTGCWERCATRPACLRMPDESGTRI
jgi:DNA-binding FadR family transcriptional regulator